MLFSWCERTRLNQGMWDFSRVCIFFFSYIVRFYSKVSRFKASRGVDVRVFEKSQFLLGSARSVNV